MSCFSRFSTSFSYYGLSMDLQKFGVDIYLIQVIFGAVDIPAKIVVTVAMSMIGRRLSQCASLVLAGITILANLLVPYGKHAKIVGSINLWQLYYVLKRLEGYNEFLWCIFLYMCRTADIAYLLGSPWERLSGCCLQLLLPLLRGTISHSGPVILLFIRIIFL